MQILLFVTQEDTENVRRAKALRAALNRAGWPARIVNRLSNDMDDLLLAARWDAVHLPQCLVVVDDREWSREMRMPSFNETMRVLEKL